MIEKHIIDPEYFTYRRLVTNPNIFKRYQANWFRINTIPPYETRVYQWRNEHYCEPGNPTEATKIDFDQYVLEPGNGWPELLQFPEQLLEHKYNQQIYIVIVSFDYYQMHLEKGKMPDLQVSIVDIPYPIITPYNDPYGYNTRILTKEEIFEIEENDKGAGYVITSGAKLNRPITPLISTNLHPSCDEIYSACFTNEHVANDYAISVEKYITKMVSIWDNRSWI